MKVWVLVILYSYMIPEHFYKISNTFMQFPYTFIWSWTLSYNPKLNINPHSRNTLFNQKRWLKKGYYGNEGLDFSNLAHFYTISNAFIRFPCALIWSWTLLYSHNSIKYLQWNVSKLSLYYSDYINYSCVKNG